MRYLLCLLLALGSFSAQAISSIQEQLQLTHPDFSEPLIFNVSLPAGYHSSPEREYVLMFDFHPHANSYLTGMHDWLSHNGQWPWLQTIIVTPQAGNRVGMLFDASGRTTPLLDFFEQTLIPQLDKRHRTNGFRIFSGFRVNGTIVLSALINKPNLFNAHIAISPELQNDYAGILSTSAKKLRKLDDKPRFLLFSHGDNVKEAHQQASYSQLQSILTKHSPSQLDWHSQSYPEHYFMSLPLLSVITGIEKLFDDIHHGLPANSTISQQGVAAIIAHYDYLSSQKYGFSVSPKNSIKQLGNALLVSEPSEGIKVFQQLQQHYPDDAYSYHDLAQAYASTGNYAMAAAQQRLAVERAANMAGWHQKRISKALDEYLKKLE